MYYFILYYFDFFDKFLLSVFDTFKMSKIFGYFLFFALHLQFFLLFTRHARLEDHQKVEGNEQERSRFFRQFSLSSNFIQTYKA